MWLPRCDRFSRRHELAQTAVPLRWLLNVSAVSIAYGMRPECGLGRPRSHGSLLVRHLEAVLFRQRDLGDLDAIQTNNGMIRSFHGRSACTKRLRILSEALLSKAGMR